MRKKGTVGIERAFGDEPFEVLIEKIIRYKLGGVRLPAKRGGGL